MSDELSSTVILLGAGASVEAGVPAAHAMTGAIDALFQEDERYYQAAFRLIVGGLTMQLAANNPETITVDIETVLTAAKLLSARSEIEMAAFVANWLPLIDEAERSYRQASIERGVARLTDAVERAIETSLAGATRGPRSGVRLDRNAVGSVFSAMTQESDGYLFHRLAQVLTGKLLHLTWIVDPEKVAYLEPLFAEAHTRRLSIATLNYDNSVELCCDRMGIKCDTGLEHWIKNNEIPSLDTGVELLKLHGSCNWFWNESVERKDVSRDRRQYISNLRHDNIDIADNITMKAVSEGRFSAEYAGKRLGVIFGGGNKLTAKGPFLDLMIRFQERLKEAKHLVVIGYYFRDDHVNACISKWLTYPKEGKRVTVIDKKPRENWWNADLSYINDHLPHQTGQASPMLRREINGAGAGIQTVFARDASPDV